MAGIDLPPIVGPSAPSVAGSYLSNLGQQITNFGMSLGRQYNAQQQALLDMESAKQVIQAKSLAYESINQFNQGLDTNVDYQKYGDAWNEFKSGLNDSLSSVLTLPQAQQTFEEWWVPTQSQQEKTVYEKAREKTVAAAGASLNVAVDQYAQQGNEQAIYDTIKQGVAAGFFDAAQGSSIAKTKIPEAHFNAVFNFLDKAGTEQEAIKTLTESGAADNYGLTADQLDQMISKFSSKLKAQNDVTNANIQAQQKETFTKIIQDSSDPSTTPSVDDLNKALVVMVGSPYYNDVKSLRDSIQTATADNLKAMEVKGETQTYSGIATMIRNWDGTGPGPVTNDGINELVTTDDPYINLTKEDGDKLANLLQQRKDEFAAGKFGPNHDDPTKVNELWKIALDVSHGWTATEKDGFIRAKGYLGNGVSGPTEKTILDTAGTSETNSTKNRYYKPIQDWYAAQMTALSTKTGQEGAMQKIAFDESTALQTLRQVILENPNDESKWSAAVDDMMTANITDVVGKQVTDKLSASFPGFFGIGATTPEMRLNTAMEQFPELKNNPKFMAEYKTALPKIEEKEREILGNAGVKDIKAAKQAPNGDLNYQTSDGSIYKVVGENVNGKIRSVIYKVVNGAWVKQ